MDNSFILFLLGLYFLAFIGPFHLIAWTIRYFTRKGKPTAYIDSLMNYIRYVAYYALGFIALFPISKLVDIEWLSGIYIALAILFPFYYWKNIFWPTFKKRIGR